MYKELTTETELGNQIAITYNKYVDTDYVDGRCIRKEYVIDDIVIEMNGSELMFEDLNGRNQEFILDEINEA